ncbi:ATP-binding protein [Achromobacter denitrificans]|uniref:ATP-binding protein n=1 Tax=Achromobacter denitrificans TaxID=32002 RepID=UPI003CFEFE2C
MLPPPCRYPAHRVPLRWLKPGLALLAWAAPPGARAGSLFANAGRLAQAWLTLTQIVCSAGLFIALIALILLQRKARQHARSEEKLKDLLAFQLGVLNAIPQPITLRDLDLKLIACNSSYEKLLMQPKHVLMGTTLEGALRRLSCDLDIARIEEDYRTVMTTGLALCKDREFHARGKAMCVENWMEPLRNARGKVVGVVSGWMDITHRQRVLKELAVARDSTENANRTKSTFLAAVSHEIRTPMNAIMGMLDLALSHPTLPVDDRSLLATAHLAAKSLLALIDDLLDLSKMEAGKFKLQPRPTRLHDLVKEVVDTFRPIAASKGVALSMRAEAPEGAAVLHNVDPLRLKQVMNNFVSNAIRYTAKGSVQVRLDIEGPEGDGQWMAFKVADTGIGIPATALDTLLHPFVQVEQAQPPTDQGTGLGLYVCDRLVKKMGGTITIDSLWGAGTTMTARIPLPPAPPDAAHTDGTVPAGGRLRVLVVDDQASNVLLLTRQLEKLGHEVASADNGQAALAQIERAPFDLVMCDCAMPVMDGYAFARALRQRDDAAARLPIIGYTAGVCEEQIARARAAGMNDVLIKPVDIDALRRVLAALPAMPA